MLDLAIVWPSSYGSSPQLGSSGAPVTVEKCLGMASELGYDVVALNIVTSGGGKTPPSPFTPSIMKALADQYPKLRSILRRVTFILDQDKSNLPTTINGYDIVAVQPRSEKALQQAATTLDIDLISLDMTNRLSFHLKHKIACAAVARGVRFEIAYASAVNGNEDSRRQCIANASAIFRATRNRGIVASSGTSFPQSIRAPLDVVNLLTVWGLNSAKARESIDAQAKQAAMNGLLRVKSAKQAIVVDSKQETDAQKANEKDTVKDKEPPAKKHRQH